MNVRSRYEEYLICKERGHLGSAHYSASIPPKRECAKCGAWYWTEVVQHESNVPAPDGSEA